MGAKSSKQTLSRDQQKLHAYYKPNLNDSKIKVIQTQARNLKIKYITKAFVIGFILQYCLGVSKIYDQINARSTMRRLDAKKKEDMELGQKRGKINLQNRAV